MDCAASGADDGRVAFWPAARKSDTPAQPEQGQTEQEENQTQPEENPAEEEQPDVTGKPGRYAQESGRCGKAR